VTHQDAPGCGFPAPVPGMCGQPAGSNEEKVFDSIGNEEGLPFAIYRGIECDLSDDYQSRAQLELEMGESAAVESIIQDQILNATGVNVVGSDIPVATALARLEQEAGELYSGLPTLHVSRFGATHLIAARL